MMISKHNNRKESDLKSHYELAQALSAQNAEMSRLLTQSAKVIEDLQKENKALKRLLKKRHLKQNW